MADPDDLARQMDALRRRFEAGLPARLAALRECCDALERGEGAASLRKLQQTAHSLAGIAGSFGRQDITDQARLVEQTVERWLQSGRSPDSASIRTVRRLVDTIIR